MDPKPDYTCFRVRMKYTGNDENKDYSKDAWNRNEVGIWYGAWSAEDFKSALTQSNPKRMLNDLPAQKLIVDWEVQSQTVKMVERFCNIRDIDWIYACFGEAIHFAKVQGPLQSEVNHDFSINGELWKYRKIVQKKVFPLPQLPDFYRLIPQAGRGNIFQTWGNNREALRILASCQDTNEVANTFKQMTDKERLDFLGPSEWESFCLGYLILEKEFLPTGLSVGRTLEGLDIVGRNSKTGHSILAQCKKDQTIEEIDQKFIEKVEPYGVKADAYYFAYGGLKQPFSSRVNEITGKMMESWIQSEPGKSYFANFFQSSSDSKNTQR
ncbi:MAG: hypothetical protein LZF86_110011 [Nitrospira sp.]|nr:MAG: hypothetical protein LZF86_110011 [Nitrospira sp.]